MQPANRILLIRPQNFGYNAETAASNKFQIKADSSEDVHVKHLALAEFDRFAEILRSKGVKVFIFEDTGQPANPDAVFPNNWVSFHADGTVILYPMCAESRRSERRRDILESLGREFLVDKIHDLSHFEKENRFLEGTGSIVFDHVSNTAYACLSPRTDETLFTDTARTLGFVPIRFRAVDANGHAIYHTNVMMCIGVGFAVICLESIENGGEAEAVSRSLQESGLEIIEIDFEQMNSFAGNMLAVTDANGKIVTVLSQSALDALRPEQISSLEKYGELLPIAIPTIERIGGGSVRCMMAEIFLPELTGP